MPSIAAVLKQEITRLARKEMKTQTEVTRKASAQHRRDIAQLKRQVAGLSKQVAYLEQQERKRAAAILNLKKGSPCPISLKCSNRRSPASLERK